MYRAPEMCDLYMRSVLTEKTDVWALGCIFYALCFLKHPFQDVGPLGIIAGKYTIPPAATVSSDAMEFLRLMLDVSACSHSPLVIPVLIFFFYSRDID